MGCSKKILKGTYRIGISHSYYGHSSMHWYHIKCYPKADGVKFPALTSGFYGYRDLPKKEKRALRKAVWPNQVSDKQKPRIKLLKELNKMTVKDLKLELERRDLKRNGRKQELKDRLEEYLQQKQCRKVYELLVIGYCSKREKKYGLIMPLYLMQIVNSYFPFCV